MGGYASFKVMSDGAVDMKVTNQKPAGFYVRAAKSFFTGVEDKEGNKKEPVCVLNISGLGEAISTAVAAAANVEKEGLATIHKIETGYPDMEGKGGSQHGCSRIMITMHKK